MRYRSRFLPNQQVGFMERMSLEFTGKVALLKFNHPEVMNAVGSQMLMDFSDGRQNAYWRHGRD